MLSAIGRTSCCVAASIIMGHCWLEALTLPGTIWRVWTAVIISAALRERAPNCTAFWAWLLVCAVVTAAWTCPKLKCLLLVEAAPQPWYTDMGCRVY